MLACAIAATAPVAASAAIPHRHESTPNPTVTGDMDGMTGEMPGMDHGTGSAEMPGMDHGTGSAEMPGMDHGTGSAEMPGMDHGTGGPAPDRPLGMVLGGFGAGSAAVMASAAFVRRRDLGTGRTGRGRIHTRTYRS